MPQVKTAPMAGKPALVLSAAERADFGARLNAGAVALDLRLDAGQVEQLLDYLALLVKWNAVYNLTAVREPAKMVSQHLLDSLSVVSAFTDAERVLDVGAGGGLPGIVLAIWARVAAPALRISLIDTVHKKTAFLTQVKAELGLTNVSIHTGRVEQLESTLPFDIITSRAFADLADFVNWSAHLLAPQGRFLAMKGVFPEQEIQNLPSGWVAAEVRMLQVPELEGERHLISIRRHEEGAPAAPDSAK